MGLNIRSGLVAAAAVLASAGAWANSYTIVDLGANKEPWQRNHRGLIVSTAQHDAWLSAVVYRDGRWRRLDNRDHDNAGEAVNSVGDIAGFVQGVPVVWPHATRDAIPIQVPDNFASILSVRGFAKDRTMAGQYISTDGLYRCFLATGMVGHDLGFPDQGDLCAPGGMNKHGEIAVTANRTPGGQSRAFVWTQAVFHELKMPPGTSWAGASAINDRAQVVGTFMKKGISHAYLWDHGVAKDIGESSQFPDTYAFGLNGVGDIVGEGDSLDGRQHAVRFTEGRAVDLASEVLNLGRWKLEYAKDVGDDGVIIGAGHIDGNVHGFMLAPATVYASH